MVDEGVAIPFESAWVLYSLVRRRRYCPGFIGQAGLPICILPLTLLHHRCVQELVLS